MNWWCRLLRWKILVRYNFGEKSSVHLCARWTRDVCKRPSKSVKWAVTYATGGQQTSVAWRWTMCRNHTSLQSILSLRQNLEYDNRRGLSLKRPKNLQNQILEVRKWGRNCYRKLKNRQKQPRSSVTDTEGRGFPAAQSGQPCSVQEDLGKLLNISENL